MSLSDESKEVVRILQKGLPQIMTDMEESASYYIPYEARHLIDKTDIELMHMETGKIFNTSIVIIGRYDETDGVFEWRVAAKNTLTNSVVEKFIMTGIDSTIIKSMFVQRVECSKMDIPLLMAMCAFIDRTVTTFGLVVIPGPSNIELFDWMSIMMEVGQKKVNLND